MLHRRELLRFGLALGIFASACAATDALEAQLLPSGARIKELAGPIWFGLRLDSRARTLDKTIFLRECNAGEFTHYPAWGGWPERGEYGLSVLGANNDYFRNAGVPSIMHMFVGPDQYLPSWLKDGTWDQETLDQLLRELISSTISSVEGRDISVWNVVNEAIDWGGTGWGGTKFLELGYEADASGLTGDDRIFDEVPVYVRKAFEYARQSSGAELELRDYDNDGLQNQYDNSIVKTKAFYQLVRHLLALETPLDVVGLQGHFNIDNAITWSRLTDNVRRYRSLGLKVLISEMDAQQNDNAKTWDDSIADVQGAYYYDYVRAALIGGVNGIFVWGVRDNQDRGWRSGENAVLFDAAGDPKPAYYGVQRAFAEFASTAGSAGDFAVTSSHAGGGGGTSAASASDGRGGAAFAMGGAAGRGGTGSGAGTTQNIELELAPKGAGGEADSDVESDSLDGQPTEPSSPGHDPNTTAGGGEHARAQSSSSAQRPRLNQLGGGGCACGAAPARDLPVQVLFFALLALRARKRAREAGDT